MGCSGIHPQSESAQQRSRAGSPVLAALPGTLFVASSVATSNTKQQPPSSSSHSCSPLLVATTSSHSPSNATSPGVCNNNFSKVDKLSQAHVVFSSLDEQKLSFRGLTNSGNGTPVLNSRSRKAQALDTESTRNSKKKNLIGVTLRKLKNSSVSPCRSPSSLTYSSSSSQVLKSDTSESSPVLLPLLAAKPDRCGCSQATLTPSLSRSTAFRDSRRDIRSNVSSNSLDTVQTNIPHNTCDISSSHLLHNPFLATSTSSKCNGCTGTAKCNGTSSSGVHSKHACKAGDASPSQHACKAGAVSPSQHSCKVGAVSPLAPQSSSSQSSPASSGNVNISQFSKSKCHKKSTNTNAKLKTTGSPSKKKYGTRASTLSPPLTSRSSPRHTQARPLQKEFNSMLQLTEAKKGKEISLRMKTRDARHNRKERIRRNKNAQILHSNNPKVIPLDRAGQKNYSQNMSSKREQFFGNDMRGQSPDSRSSCMEGSTTTSSSNSSCSSSSCSSSCSDVITPQCGAHPDAVTSSGDGPDAAAAASSSVPGSASCQELTLAQRRRQKVRKVSSSA